MPISKPRPTPGGHNNSWGTVLNEYLAEVETAVERVDPGSAGSARKYVRIQPDGEPDWVEDAEIDATDYVTTSAAQPGLVEAFTDAGWNTGEAAGSLVASGARPVRLPHGTLYMQDGLALNNVWNTGIRGAGMTALAPDAGGPMDYLLFLNGVGYAIVENLAFGRPGNTDVVTDVFRFDGADGAFASVKLLRLRDLQVDDLTYVTAFAMGKYSNGDVANFFYRDMAVRGEWTTGEATLYQHGFYFGGNSAGNNHSHVLDGAMIGGTRYGLYIAQTNVHARDVFFDTGEYAVAGSPRNTFVLDGFRIEDFHGFVTFPNASSGPNQFIFRNGDYNHNLTVTELAANFKTGGNVIFENVRWISSNHATSKPRFDFSTDRGRQVTFRNFAARQTPEELEMYAPGHFWNWVHFVFDGYSVVAADGSTSRIIRGLYTRSVSSSVNFAPFDGILKVDATGGARTVTMPTASRMGGREAHIVKTDAGANAVTISRSGTDTIGGATSISLAAQGDYAHLTSDGVSDWFVRSRS